MVAVNYGRVREVALLLAPLRDHLYGLLRRDPQYSAVKVLVDSRGLNTATLLVVSNSLISYQLSIPGEAYWTAFADFFSKKGDEISPGLFREFLIYVKCTRLLDRKIERIERFLRSSVASKLLHDGLLYCNDVKRLLTELSLAMGSRGLSKTLLFAVKMYSYVCDVVGIKPSYNLPIPPDYRNALLALTSCIVVDCVGKRIKECAVELTKPSYAKWVQEAWSTVCAHANIPCLLLDVFTWLFAGKAVEARFNPTKAVALFKEEYGVSVPQEVARVLLECVEKHV